MQVPSWARALGALALSWAAMAAPAQAGIISYNLTAVVNHFGGVASLAGTGIDVGTQVTASMWVDDTKLPDAATLTPSYAYYQQAVVGGTVSAAGMTWTMGGNTADNYASVWNNLDEGGGNTMDALWVSSPLASGPSPNGLAPYYFGFVLFDMETGNAGGLDSTAFPTSVDLADFALFHGASLNFGTLGNAAAASLDITSFSVSRVAEVPEPGTLALLLAGGLGGVAAWRQRRATATR